MTFVKYEFTSGDDQNVFEQFREFLKGLLEKYEARIVPSEAVCGEPLNALSTPIELYLNTPGLSDNYLDEPEDPDEADRAFEFFGRNDGKHPPKPEVAIAVAFGDSGDDEYYLGGLDSSIGLLSDKNKISPRVRTDLTNQEAQALAAYIQKVRIKETEFYSEY